MTTHRTVVLGPNGPLMTSAGACMHMMHTNSCTHTHTHTNTHKQNMKKTNLFKKIKTTQNHQGPQVETTEARKAMDGRSEEKRGDALRMVKKSRI